MPLLIMARRLLLSSFETDGADGGARKRDSLRWSAHGEDNYGEASQTFSGDYKPMALRQRPTSHDEVLLHLVFPLLTSPALRRWLARRQRWHTSLPMGEAAAMRRGGTREKGLVMRLPWPVQTFVRKRAA